MGCAWFRKWVVLHRNLINGPTNIYWRSRGPFTLSGAGAQRKGPTSRRSTGRMLPEHNLPQWFRLLGSSGVHNLVSWNPPITEIVYATRRPACGTLMWIGEIGHIPHNLHQQRSLFVTPLARYQPNHQFLTFRGVHVAHEMMQLNVIMLGPLRGISC